MPSRRTLILAPLAFAATAVGVVTGVSGAQDPAPLTATSPPTERPLLGAPDPSGPTTRGVFLEDPLGQVESIAAGGHLVAWSVRTPTDDTYSKSDRDPIKFPKTSKVVVVDERGGAPLKLDLGRRWVTGLRMLQGAGGAAEPQLAVSSCGSRKPASCTSELLTFGAPAGATSPTPAASSPAAEAPPAPADAQTPVAVIRREAGAVAKYAASGVSDRGQRIVAAKRAKLSSGRRACLPRLSIRNDAAGTNRRLRALPPSEDWYARCKGMNERLLVGNYAFAWVRREEPKLGLEADFVYGLDTTAGPKARWREVQRPYRYSDGSTGFEVGPGVRGDALFWEETNDDSTIYSLEQVLLPRDLVAAPKATTPTRSDAIAPKGLNACDVAATDDALYELGNTRCAGYSDSNDKSGQIRRLVNPQFRPNDDR